MAEFDNIQKIAPFLDKHLLFPLLEHVQSQNVSHLDTFTCDCTLAQPRDGSIKTSGNERIMEKFDPSSGLRANVAVAFLAFLLFAANSAPADVQTGECTLLQTKNCADW